MLVRLDNHNNDNNDQINHIMSYVTYAVGSDAILGMMVTPINAKLILKSTVQINA